jgi:predicted kinase
VHDRQVPECVILVGLPASGKTTFYQQRFAATHRHISKDHWPNTARKDQRQAQLIRSAFRAGAPVVIDNTNPSLSDRAAIVELAREFSARIIGYYFTATSREAVGRNRGREGKQRVPDVAIFATAKRMVVPTRTEGFDELYRAAIRADGGFDVTPALEQSERAAPLDDIDQRER